MHPKTLLTLPLILTLASPVLALSDAEMLAKCDGMTRAGTIDPTLKDGVIGGFAEKQCKTKVEIAQDRDIIAQSRANIVKLDAESQRFDQIIAMLPKDETKRALNLELTKTEQELRTTNAPEQREKLEIRIRIIKEQLVKLK